MKKILFVFAAAVCTVLSSCKKEDTGSSSTQDPTPAQEVEKSIDFILVSMPSQRNYIDQKFEFDVNGKTVSFKESEMTEVTGEASLKQFNTLKTSVDKALKFMEDDQPSEAAQYYKYSLGTLKKGETVNAISRTALIKSDRPSTSVFNFLDGSTLLADGKEASDVIEVKYHKGVYNTDEEITGFFKILFKKFSQSYNCK